MQVLWTPSECSVGEMVGRLAQPLPYTTVLTVLDRLHRKGLAVRRKRRRAFLYAPRVTREEWQKKQVDRLVTGLLVQEPSGELLVSCLVEALTQEDLTLLDELERKIEMKRQTLAGG